MKLATMAPTSQDIPAMLQEDPYEIFLSTQVVDNSCETYFYCACPPSVKTTIPEASPAFRRALGSMDVKGDYNIYQPDSDDSTDEEDSNRDKAQTVRIKTPKPTSSASSDCSSSSPSSSLSSSPSTSPISSPRTSPQHARSSPRMISSPQLCPRKTRFSTTSSSKNASKFLSVPTSSSLPTDGLSAPCSKAADSSDSGAHNTLAGVALRKGCTRKAASFGGYDTIKVEAGRFEKRVSWADERGSKHQLIHVRLIRPRLTMSTSDGRSSTPGQSILKTPDNST